ncbi:hypothetical protein ACWPKO_30715 (plasmid) [Coraliomargarita sp. W4R53]
MARRSQRAIQTFVTDDELDRTILHEYAHLLTLRDSQLDRYTADSFVTEYAAKNPDEDIAEVFAEWMLLSGVATGDQIVDQKLRFFDDYPELVSFRDEVAQVL